MFLPFLPLSYMVVLNREIVNKYIFSSQSVMSTSKKGNTTLEDINMDELKERSKSSSLNISRELSAHSDLSSDLYMNRLEVQSKDSMWANQTEQISFQLFYSSHKEGKNNNSEEAKKIFSIYVEDMNNNRTNMNLPHRFESVPLTYSDDQLTNQNS